MTILNQVFIRKLVLLALLFLFCVAQSQEAKDDINFIGKSKDKEDLSITINASSTHNIFQDIKRGVSMFHFPERKEDEHRLISTGTIINTIKNSYAEDGSRIVLLSAAVHNLGFDNPLNVGDDLIFYMSFDNETSRNIEPSSNYEQYKNDLSEIFIHRLWKTKVKILVLDKEADIVLLEVNFGNTDEDPSLEQHLGFLNTYALGWNLHPYKNAKNFTNISHPRGDHKKIFQAYNSKLGSRTKNYYLDTIVPKKFMTLKNSLFDFALNPLLLTDEYVWRNRAGKISVGASGSSLLDSSGKAIAILHTLRSSWSLLENSWALSRDNSIPDLRKYLDPDETWISSVPGGYLKDLIPNSSEINFDLEVNNNPKTKTININAVDFFDFIEFNNTTTTVLADGILTAESNTEEVIMYLTLNSDPNFLLYGVTYNGNMSLFETIFKGNSWEQGENPFEILNFPTNNIDDSDDIKNSILAHLRSVASQGVSFLRLRGYNFDSKLHLASKSGTAKVRAIKLPNQMPYNAVELFEPERFANLWRSYKYKPSTGKNSDAFYIGDVKVEFEQYVSLEGVGCVAIPKRTLQEITTGNNGGYLNLVNPNYLIDNVVASEADCSKNKLILTINTTTSSLKHYGAWLDYFKDKKEDGNDNPEDNYTYNFLEDNQVHSEEQLVLNSTDNNEIIIEHEIPFVSELPLDSKNPIILTRLRLAIANQPEGDNSALTQDGFYEQGEVEDYLVKVRPSSNEDKQKAILHAHIPIILMEEAKENDVCNNGDALIGDGVDETEPEQNLPIYGDAACGGVLDFVSNNIGKNAIIFNGTMYMGVAQGGDLVHKPSSKKTIAIDFLIAAIDKDKDEILFEEGGGENGVSLRIKYNKIEFGVKINGVLVVIKTLNAMPENQMINVTAVFNEGVLELYINGKLEATDAQFSLQNSTKNIPEHLDAAGLGGTAGPTTIWNSVLNNFNGIVDYFAYWDTALTATMIGVLATRISTSNNKARVAKVNDKPLKTKEKPVIPDFSIYPNPVKDELNILVEIEQVGPLKIDLFDINGRKVYEMMKPTISKGHQLITLRDMKIAAGEYIMSIRAGNIKRNEKVIFK
jgi:hypothetical protein